MPLCTNRHLPIMSSGSGNLQSDIPVYSWVPFAAGAITTLPGMGSLGP
jgi:hypothetical protein